ncbi:magnesium transporter CorA family protein [Vagococcus silagei]|uniref:Magnesium transporter CorA family protein n=1 Tax=Vagococcus silagei TaxID=2508885 RepID=A0A4S3B0S6_9ENTE|nr:magnesium transporter CorA family protein [Vagococcus silagei]THB60611.1 magnesium transporter CorA family protein [Vagococcus silagei]
MLTKHIVHENLVWVESNQFSEQDRSILLNEYSLPLGLLDYVSDDYEQSTYDYNAASGYHLMVINLPVLLERKVRYTTRPISFLFNESIIFTFNTGESDAINEALRKQITENKAQLTVNKMLASGLEEAFQYFMTCFHTVMKTRHELDELISRHMTNQNLLELSYLQQTFSYFNHAAKSNVDALQMMLDAEYGKLLRPVEIEHFENLMVEANQIKHMVRLESEVVDKVAQVFDSVNNNNLNSTMSILTFWSLALAVPTLVTGFYGMNVLLPSISPKYDWLILLVISIVLIFLLIWTIKNSKRFK